LVCVLNLPALGRKLYIEKAPESTTILDGYVLIAVVYPTEPSGGGTAVSAAASICSAEGCMFSRTMTFSKQAARCGTGF
jgi:hypothetical protein